MNPAPPVTTVTAGRTPPIARWYPDLRGGLLTFRPRSGRRTVVLMVPRLRCLPLLVLALAAALPAAAPAAPIPDGFYTASPGSIPAAHGLMMKSMPISGAALPKTGKSHLVLYSSESPGGDIVPVSGLVTIPKGKAPKGGFPVVSWAHGTTGIADSCAPSRRATSPPDDAYVENFAKQVAHWVRRGYVVAQTDYQGLGTTGMHPYLIGVSEGRSVVDAVLAARGLSRKVGKRWVAMGHSQGGHAVLWAAALAKAYAPSLKLTGALPLAPASHLAEQAALIDTLPGNPLGGLPALIVAAGLQSAGIAPGAALSDKALALYPQIEQVCLDRLSAADSWGGLPLNEMLREGFDRAPLIAALAANDPEDLTIKVPLLIAQGEADSVVFPPLTEQTATDLEGRGARVTYKPYPGASHGTVVRAASKDIVRFLKRRLG